MGLFARIVVGIIMAAGIATVAGASVLPRTMGHNNVPSIVPTEQNSSYLQATLDVLGEGNEPQSYQARVSHGTTAYEFMEHLQEVSALSFEGREFAGIGFFVEEINGLRQSPRNKKYWIYSINGQKAEIGISHYLLQPHDVITWTYEDAY